MIESILNLTRSPRLAAAAFALFLLPLVGCDFGGAAGGNSSLSITSTPDHAEVYIDGKPQGPTPKTIQGLVPRDYLIELRAEGFETVLKSISLLEGQQMKLTLELTRVTGLLLVESNPAGADVLMEGISKGNTPLLFTDLPLGSYQFEFRSENHLPRVMSTELVDRKPVQLFAELMSNTARLTVTSKPDGAEIRVNGVLVGTAPTTVEEVHAGETDIRISKRGYKPFTKSMLFEANKPYEISAELEALPSGLTIITEPAGALVMVDHKAVGESPVTLENLKDGPHEVIATLDGYATKTKNIYLEPDLNDSVEFTMVKNSGTLVIDTEPAGVEIYIDGKLLTTTRPKGGSDTLSQPVRVTLKSDADHTVQLVREGYVSLTTAVRTEIDQVVTKHEVLKRIFVYDSKIVLDDEIIKCRVEYKLPNGNIYYERYPGVFDTAKAADIRDVQPISIDDASNREARRLIELNKDATPTE